MNRRKQIRTLWQRCFDDSDASLEYFFDRVYKDENAISIEKEGQVVSVLQMLPYRMRWCGATIPVSYIYAACTAPEERGRGLMHDLLLQAFTTMRERGILFTLLIPANPGLFDYYRGQGYTEVFDYSTETYTVNSVTKSASNNITSTASRYTSVAVDEHTAGDWFPYLQTKQCERPLTVVHTEDDFRYLVGDIRINDGLVIGLLDEKEEPVGMAFASEIDGEMLVRELFHDTDDAKRQLLYEVMSRLGITSLTVLTPPRLPDAHCMGMGIVLNRAEMIRLWGDYHHASADTIRQLNGIDTPRLTSLLLDYSHRTGSLSLLPD